MKKLLKDHRRLFKFLLLFYAFAFVYVLATAFTQKWFELGYNTYSWSELVLIVFLNYLTKSFFLFFAVLFSIRYLSVRLSILQSIPIHVALTLLFSFYSSFALIVMEKTIFGIDQELSLETVLSRTTYGSTFNFFLYFAIISIVYANIFLSRQQQQKVREERLKTQLLDAKITALQAQIEPHFLFNALNDISSLVTIDSKKSQDAIADLSDLLRFTMSVSKKNFITLKTELEILEKYLEIQKIRFDDKLQIRWDVDKELLQKPVPPFLFQPILENAIQHGYSRDHKILRINIEIRESQEKLVVLIKNDGKSLPISGFSYGTGISNILMRLKELYGKDHYFDMKNDGPEGVLTKVAFPIAPSGKTIPG